MTVTQEKRRRNSKRCGERKPVYHADDPQRRVVSVPDGLWQSQIRTDEKGTRERSNWFAPHSPCSKVDAMTQMDFGYGGRAFV